jgi:two-component system CheB/CheR fusion protein
MNIDLQTKVMMQFQYALAPHGFLFLGSSESICEFTNLFLIIDRKLKLFQRIESINMITQHSKREISSKQLRVKNNEHSPESITMKISANENKIPLRELTEKNLLLQLAPTAVLINDQFEILYLNGRTGLYLEPARGEANMNILKMARDGLRSDLTAAINLSISKNETIQVKGIEVKTIGSKVKINLIVRPVTNKHSLKNNSQFYLVIFAQDMNLIDEESDSTIISLGKMEDKAKIEALEQELIKNEDSLKRAQIESIISHQEMQSSNEELQTANEELQTSKEELQSVNEELATINSELHIKVVELSHANNDMNNLLAGSGIGTIFVDHNKAIVRFTPSATKLINLIQSDIGRPLGHIVTNFKNYSLLLSDVQIVLDELVTKETDIQTLDGNYFHMRIRPYRTLENIIEGAVITFFDVNEINKMRNALNETIESARLLSIIIKDTRDAVIVQDLNGLILAWNPAAQSIYGLNEQEAIGMNIRDLMVSADKNEEIDNIKNACKNSLPVKYQTKRVTKSGTIVNINVTATALIDHGKKQYAVATIERMVDKLT